MQFGINLGYLEERVGKTSFDAHKLIFGKVGLGAPCSGMKKPGTKLPLLLYPDLQAQRKTYSGSVNKMFRNC